MENLTTTIMPEPLVKLLTFSWVDYSIFFFMFGISAVIGIYFGCYGSKQNTVSEYLLGSRTMGIFPIGISLTASHLSGISLLGIPSEIYMYGTQYLACIFTVIIVIVITIYVYLPVFYNLKLNSSFEYLKLRFDERLRLMALVLFIIGTLLYIPIVIYIPALAFNLVSGVAISQIAPIICGICIFYTTIGGLKAVVWTDTVQFIITLISMFTLFIMGIIAAGGIGNIWDASVTGDRIEMFNFNLDPTVRTSFWGIVIGLSGSWLTGLGLNPATVQRFMAVPSLKKAKMSLIIFGFGVLFTKSIVCFFGLIMYARYKDCDPYSAGQIHRVDQILPYYVLDVAANIPGLPGIFVSGIFSTALSTMSTNLNTLAGAIYEDFIKRFMTPKANESLANNIIKVTVVLLGVICVGLVFVVKNLGGVIQISGCFAGINSGPLLGLFTLGMLFPSVTADGALYGSLTSLIVMVWIIGGFEYHYLHRNIIYHYRPLSIEKCEYITPFLRNVTSSSLRFPETRNDPLFIFQLSFYWYPIIGAGVTIIVGLLISWLSKKDNPKRFDKELYSPVIHKFFTWKEYSKVSIDSEKEEYREIFINGNTVD